ncbi:alpha-galactosidase a precursor [Fusarium agapanthi]|uniref:Alpha-galactosidase a n=1 Tax=Fusarium agapanthi TaxID=1803897 RepID=A0A9P5BK97_9HYPO|nr:alpha-galactosidase a precursor [Fusarium agapanthi]
MKHNNNVRLLAVLADPESDEKSEYRFLVDGAHVRYVTLDGGLIDPEHRTYEPKLLPQLPVFPPGDWNEGRVGKDGHTGKPFFCETRRSSLPGIGNVWHDVMIDHLELRQIERVRQTLYRVSHPAFKTPVLAKFAQFPWEIPYFAAETTSYEWIHGQGIGPEFLGHIHENGRVIGFLLEEIHNARTAEPEDLATCQRSLQKLHDLGIVHGDINKHNFLIRQDGDAVLIDFETAYKCTDLDILDEEYRHVKESLEDTSGRGGAGMASDSSSD